MILVAADGMLSEPVAEMPSGPTVPVQSLWWQELRQPIFGVDPDFPAAVVVQLSFRRLHQGVVVRAEQDPVVEAGPHPRSDVVGVAAPGGLVATGEDTATVARDECGTELALDEPLRLPDIQRDAEGVEDHRNDLGITGQQAELLGRHLLSGYIG